jgi:AraC-like DNA-binding protein
MSSGIPSIVQVGEYLGMSARTLKRRLSERNLSFRELIQKNQQETATQLLTTTSQSIGEIAFLTGFSEQSAFNRAFNAGQYKIQINTEKRCNSFITSIFW